MSCSRARPAARARRRRRSPKKLKIIEDLGAGAARGSVLKAAGWPERDGTVVVVGHQPTLGQTIALALTGKDEGWGLQERRALVAREPRRRRSVRAVIGPDLV